MRKGSTNSSGLHPSANTGIAATDSKIVIIVFQPLQFDFLSIDAGSRAEALSGSDQLRLRSLSYVIPETVGSVSW